MKNITGVYLETGKKLVITGALKWPGWCRSGRNEAAALQALFDYRMRYANAIRTAENSFEPPQEIADLEVVERLEGNSSTDFGVPVIAPSRDLEPVDETELRRLQSLLRACWQTLNQAAQAAAGKELRKGPRGGGRDLEKILQHVAGAEAGYLRSIGWKIKIQPEPVAGSQELTLIRQEVLDGLAASTRGELPTRGPRGGVYWSPRYFVRRVAWHVLDHAWEIEDRIR